MSEWINLCEFHKKLNIRDTIIDRPSVMQWDVMKEFRDEGKRKANATNMPVSQFFKNIFNL